MNTITHQRVATFDILSEVRLEWRDDGLYGRPSQKLRDHFGPLNVPFEARYKANGNVSSGSVLTHEPFVIELFSDFDPNGSVEEGAADASGAEVEGAGEAVPTLRAEFSGSYKPARVSKNEIGKTLDAQHTSVIKKVSAFVLGLDFVPQATSSKTFFIHNWVRGKRYGDVGPLQGKEAEHKKMLIDAVRSVRGTHSFEVELQEPTVKPVSGQKDIFDVNVNFIVKIFRRGFSAIAIPIAYSRSGPVIVDWKYGRPELEGVDKEAMAAADQFDQQLAHDLEEAYTNNSELLPRSRPEATMHRDLSPDVRRQMDAWWAQRERVAAGRRSLWPSQEAYERERNGRQPSEWLATLPDATKPNEPGFWQALSGIFDRTISETGQTLRDWGPAGTAGVISIARTRKDTLNTLLPWIVIGGLAILLLK